MRLDIERLFADDPGPPQVVAEVGANHDRDWDTALRLIDVAVEAGAEAVKFQTYSGARLYSRKTVVAQYLKDKGLIGPDEDIVDLIGRIELPRDWQPRLDAACRARGVAFLSTPFDVQAVAELDALAVPAFKVASTEITHAPLLRAIGATRRPVILSTGMATLADIERALGALGHERVVLLQCTVAYPSVIADANLRALETLRSAFGLPLGYSDHTTGSVGACVAVALGARLLEKHITLDRKRPGPDHPFAVEPGELKDYVRAAREAHAALGSARKRPLAVEAPLRDYRPGVFAARALAAGAPLAEGDLVVKRRTGAGGIEAFDLERVVGRRLARARDADDQLEWDDV